MRFLGVALAGAAALLTLVNLPGPTGADAASVAAGGGNLRSGPGLSYQVITTLPEGQWVTIHRCKKAPAWCRVSTAGYSGWLSASRLAHEIEFQRFDRFQRHRRHQRFHRPDGAGHREIREARPRLRQDSCDSRRPTRLLLRAGVFGLVDHREVPLTRVVA